jgi:hypothetical protein
MIPYVFGNTVLDKFRFVPSVLTHVLFNNVVLFFRESDEDLATGFRTRRMRRSYFKHEIVLL